MGRMKIGIVVAGVVVTLLGAVAAVTMRSNGGSNHVNTVANVAPGDATAPALASVIPTTLAPQPVSTTNAPSAPNTAKAPASAPAATTPSSIVSQPSVQDVQKIIAGITAQVQASATTNAAPLTKEQVEAQVRDLLKQLGINI